MARKHYWDFEPPLADEGWTVVEAGASTIVRSAAAAWPDRSTVGLRVTVSGANAAYVRQDSWCDAPAAGESRTVGFWYRRTAASADTNFHEQWRVYAGAGTTSVARWLVYDDPTVGGAISAFNDAGGATSNFYANTKRPDLNRWAYVQIEVTRASSSVASDGAAALYIDGILIALASGVDNFDRFDSDGQFRIGSTAFPRDGYSADFDEIKTGQTLADVEPFAPAPFTEHPEARRTVLLVPNTSDGRSFGDYCIAQASLPHANVCVLPNATANESLADYATFQAEVETDLAAWLAARPTVAGRVTTFLLGYGTPGCFSSAGVKHSAASRLMNYGNGFVSQTANPLYDPATVARLSVTDLRGAGVYLASRIDADTLAHAKDIVDAGLAVADLPVLPSTDVLQSDETAYLATLPCQRLRIATAAIGTLTNAAFLFGDAAGATFDASGSRAAYAASGASSAASLRSPAGKSLGDALNANGWAAGLGNSETAETWDAESFFEMLRIGGTLGEAVAVAVAKVDYTAVPAGWPAITVAFATSGYNVYRGEGDISNVNFDAPVAYLRAGQTTPSLVGLGHNSSTRYTYAIRPVRNGLEGPDLSCRVELVIDDSGEWTGDRPTAVELVEAEPGPGGRVTVRWTFRTPYGQDPPADFAIYRSTGCNISPGSPDATEAYVTDGEYSHTFELSDGETCYFAITARTSQGVESELSAVVGPVRADASAPQTPTVYVSRTFQ